MFKLLISKFNIADPNKIRGIIFNPKTITQRSNRKL